MDSACGNVVAGQVVAFVLLYAVTIFDIALWLYCVRGGAAMAQQLTVERHDLDGFEGLQEAVKGTHFDILQIEPGKLSGFISHLGIGSFTLSVCAFNKGISAQRTSSDDKILIGMLLGAQDRVTQWSFDMMPTDIVVIPPRADHRGVHCGGSSYAVLRLDPRELPQVFGGDPWLSDAENWQEKNRFRANPDVGLIAGQGLSRLAHHLARQTGVLSEGAAEFWRRTIVDYMAMTISNSIPVDQGGHLASAMRLVRSVEDYLWETGDRPLHISEICFQLGLSRRSLHRAFHEVFGIGPVKFLRRKRLCAVHSILKESSPEMTTVAQVAIEQGFIELGRFSQYYRAMFGEAPSQTLSGMACPPIELAGVMTSTPSGMPRYPH
ncbi:MAG: helix-turn-helix transcriptional regulator [Bradyrhizobium sp.]|jgi:AraC-like DNA-binding protein|uniref:AraC family transcriptional regulator n=1 Tax=Bradyrhizobium sp. TaxID=376 RepID=UPI003C7395B5